MSVASVLHPAPRAFLCDCACLAAVTAAGVLTILPASGGQGALLLVLGGAFVLAVARTAASGVRLLSPAHATPNSGEGVVDVQAERPFGGAQARLERLLDEAAEAVKDLVLDLDLDPEASGAPAPGAPLPPLAPEQFAVAVHGRVEETVRRIAEAVNASADGRITAATEERVFELLADLGCDALGLGLHLRVAAAEAGLPAGSLGSGRWAGKYRRMKAAEGRWPPAASAGGRVAG